MTEPEELEVIAEVVANPTLKGLERLLQIRDYSQSDMAKLEACAAILEAWGPA
jgi:hypothetical protein